MEYKGYNFIVQRCGTMRTSQYQKLIDLIEEYKPKRICELGCGQSTFIFEHYCEKQGAQLNSIEHDMRYKRKDTQLFNLFQCTEHNIEEYNFKDCNRYHGFEEWLKQQEPFDFVVIDGPPGWGYRQNYKFGRIHLVDFPILNKLSKNCTVLVHDTQRRNIKNTLKVFEDILKQKNINFTKEQDNQMEQLTVYRLE